jgi:sec-independent protein translocase protein TatA
VATIGPMFSGNEWLIVVIIALVLFGGSQIPKLARNLGSAQKEFKKGFAEANADDDESEPASAETTTDKK